MTVEWLEFFQEGGVSRTEGSICANQVLIKSYPSLRLRARIVSQDG